MTDQIANVYPESPERLDNSIPKALAAIAMQAMRKDPSARMQSAAAFAEELRRWQRNLPVLANISKPG